MVRISDQTPAATPEPTLSLEQACYIIMRARQIGAKVAPSGLADGSNPADDREASVIEDTREDSSRRELSTFIDNLDIDRQIDIVALVWMGRGDYTAEEWRDARRAAAEARHEPVSRYLLGMPLFGDYLDEGLALTGRTCADADSDRM